MYISICIKDEDDVTDVLEEILSIKCLYFPLGECLRLASDNLKAIRKAYPDESDAEKALKAVILLWLKKKYKVAKFGLPTWKMLVEAVEKKTGGNNPMLAEEIASKHPTGMPNTKVPILLHIQLCHDGLHGQEVSMRERKITRSREGRRQRGS